MNNMQFDGFSYDFINKYNAHIKPSTTHSADNATSWYFRRYLIKWSPEYEMFIFQERTEEIVK